jgi:MFS family permease
MARKREMKFNFNLNKVIKYLVLSDLVFYTGWGLFSPLFAIFVLESIIGGTAFAVGMAAGINLIIRSLLRVPFGIYSDKNQKIAYHFMIWGLLISAFIPLGYIFARSVFHIYLLQAVLGAFLAMSTSGWTAIYSRHLDKRKESTEWGIDAVAVGIGPGIAGMVGGALITLFSFDLVFILVSLIGILGVAMLLFIKKDIMKKSNLIPSFNALRYYKNHTKHV